MTAASEVTEVRRASRAIWTTLWLIATVSAAVLLLVWIFVNPTSDTLWYEVSKACLQALGVAVIGGVVTVTTTRWQQASQRAQEAAEGRRKEAAEVTEAAHREASQLLERTRQEYQLRATLLSRAALCAQTMYVTCQHVRRIQRDAASMDPSQGATSEASELLQKAAAQLDATYLEFSAEAAALETEFRARYGAGQQPAAGLEPSVTSPGEAHRRWHQIYDLLTVYYFALTGNFRHNILRDNSKDEKHFHTGVDFTEYIPRARDQRAVDIKPTPKELMQIVQRIRQEFDSAMPVLAEATLEGTLRSP